jgi:hypothetical protein
VEIEVYMRHPDKKYDGKLYQSYSLDGEKLVARETHICELDYYKGFYELIDENQFNLITEQEGPKKDNMIRTKFRRLL